MLASSSPPKVSRVRQGPRSRATTRMPRSVSTLAAAAPDAPAPMMQTSARSGFGLGAIVCLLLGILRVHTVLGEVVQRAVAALVDLGQRGGPREADDLPTDPVPVAAIDRVGVETLPGVHGEHGEEAQVDLGVGLLQGGFHRAAIARADL